MVYRGKNGVGTFLRAILQVETEIRESLAAPQPIVMTPEDWEKFKKAADCHVCNKNLIKDQFLDSLPDWNNQTDSYGGQSHKKCFYEAQKKWYFLRLRRRLTDQNIQHQKNCIFCGNPLLKKNFRDAV